MVRKEIEFPVNCFRICIDVLGKDKIEGAIYGVAVEKSRKFHSIAELLIGLNDTMDNVGTPQSYEQIRSFTKETETEKNSFQSNPIRHHDSDVIRNMKGRITEVDVMVMTRKHANLQGIRIAESGDMLESFDSDLEFVEMIIKAAKA